MRIVATPRPAGRFPSIVKRDGDLPNRVFGRWGRVVSCQSRDRRRGGKSSPRSSRSGVGHCAHPATVLFRYAMSSASQTSGDFMAAATVLRFTRKRREATVLAMLVILFIGLTVFSEYFFTARNLANYARQISVVGIVALGQ